MIYMGGKSRIANNIALIINNIAMLEGINEYYEPFVGGGAVVQRINIENKHASDLNKYMIALYKKLQEPDMFEQPIVKDRYTYNKIKSHEIKVDDWLYCYVALAYSFKAKWFASYNAEYSTIWVDGFYRSLCKEKEQYKNVEFKCCSYKDIKPYHSIVYCDAPYIGTKQYTAVEKFNFDEYYSWLQEIAKDNLVLISEYRMPADKFKSIAVYKLSTTIGSGSDKFNKGCTEVNRSEALEQLFIVKGGWLTDKYFADKYINENEYDF